MFGDAEYDPSCSYSSVCIEEQLEALSVAVREGKVIIFHFSSELSLDFHHV
jgi:hypothetical protein